MADKFRRTFPLKISFSDGELPSSQKLTAVANQARSGSNLFEYAIGDVWNESGDSILNTFELQIPNIARMIGQNKLLNPAIYDLVQSFTFYDNFGVNHSGQQSGYLRFKPSGSISVQTAGNITGTIQTNPTNVNTVNNTYFDSSKGELHILHNSGFAGTEIVSYTVDPSNWISGNEYLPSVIPDPRQVTYTRCRLSEDSTKYYLHLPPRTRLSLNDNFERPDRYPSSDDVLDNDNLGTYASPTPYKILQDPSENAIQNTHYRYRFPKEIEDNIGALSVGEQLPYGLMYLWDHTTNSIVRDALFYKSDLAGQTDWTVKVSSVSAASDFATVAAASTNETSASYSTNARYSLICVGASIANTLKILSKMAAGHTHNNQGDMSAIIPHNNLGYRDPKPSEMEVSFTPSRWTNDPHISLLSRAGFSTTARDLNNNAMLGDLVMASTVDDGNGSYLNTTAVSNKIYFGDNTGPAIYTTLSGMILDSEKVGIGTASPSAKLHVYGGAAHTQIHIDTSSTSYIPAVYLQQGGVSKGAIDINTSSALGLWTNDGSWRKVFQANNAGNELSFMIRGSTKMIMNSSGDVGIGTIVPDTKLHVFGGSAGSVSAPTDSLLTIENDDNARLSFLTPSTSDSVGIYWGDNFDNDRAWITYAHDTDSLRMGVNTSTKMLIDSAGKVGIGTTSVVSRLHVKEPTALGNTVGNYQIISTEEGITGGNRFYCNQFLYRDSSSVSWETARWHDCISIDSSFLTPKVDTKTWWERDPFNDIQIWGNAGNAYMTLTSGRVGIGTNYVASTEKLEVSGNAEVTGNFQSTKYTTTAIPAVHCLGVLDYETFAHTSGYSNFLVGTIKTGQFNIVGTTLRIRVGLNTHSPSLSGNHRFGIFFDGATADYRYYFNPLGTFNGGSEDYVIVDAFFTVRATAVGVLSAIGHSKVTGSFALNEPNAYFDNSGNLNIYIYTQSSGVLFDGHLSAIIDIV